MIEVKVKGNVLSAESKDYDFEGQKGTSHTVRALINNAIYAFKTDAPTIKNLAKRIGEDCEMTIAFTSPKERLKASLVEVE